jgi:Ca2+-binding EF-hand superfamily protein/CRP-like cAMP-binding protein
MNVLKIKYGYVFGQTLQIIIIWIILTLDALLQLVAIKRQFGVADMNFDDEMVLASKYNLLNTACVAAPGYTLLKFTWENYGFIHNTHDKLPGLIYVSFVGISFLTGIPIVNILPRFFLGALIVFTGSGFLFTSLIQTYKQVPMLEYCGIWVMVIITALSDLTVSVLVGFIIALIIFVYKYGKKSAIKAIFTGAEYQSCVVRNHRDQLRLQHLGKLSIIVQLHRYLFFGSVVGVKDLVDSILRAREEKHALDGKIKYLIIDFEHTDGIDPTCSEVLVEIVKACHHENIVAVFTHLGEKCHRKLQHVDPKLFNEYGMHFSTQDEGVEYVEEAILLWAAQVRKRWLIFDSLKRLHGRHILQGKHEAFEEVLGDHSSDDIWKYIEKEEIKKGTELCIAGQVNHKLYVLQRGRLTSYLKAGDSHKRMTGALVRLHTMTRGAFVNEDSLYLDMPVPHTIVADRDSTVISITREKLKQMEAENPEIAIQIMRTVLMHTATIRNTLEMEVNAVDHWEEVKTQRMQAKLVSANSSGMGLTQMMSDYEFFSPEQIDLHVKSVGYDENQHYFHHLQLPEVETTTVASCQTDTNLESSDKLSDRPTLHLSGHMVDTVTECFQRHVSKSTATAKYKSDRFGLFGKLRAKQAQKRLDDGQSGQNEMKTSKAAMKNLAMENFLKQNHLSEYLTDLKKRGYDIVDDLLLAEEAEIDELASSLKQNQSDAVMGSITPHKRRFISRVNEMRNYVSSSDSNNDITNETSGNHYGIKNGAKPTTPSSSRNYIAPNVLTLYETLEALMDLGVFPTKKEIASFIDYLKNDDSTLNEFSQRTVSLNIAAKAAVVSASKQASEMALSSDLVDPDFVPSAGLIVTEAQFLQLVEMLELKPLTTSQINYFRNIFYEFADFDGALSSESLGHLMASIGHPESPLELQQLVRRWDIDGKGHIDFDNFVSMISCFLKKEEIEQEVEQDFAKFALAISNEDDEEKIDKDGNISKTTPTGRSYRRGKVNEDSVITVENILNLFRSLKIDITLDDAEEMIFEGDYNEDKSITFHEFVDLITLIHDSELT